MWSLHLGFPQKMPKARRERTDLTNKFDIMRQDEQKMLGNVRPSNKRPMTAAKEGKISECERWRADVIEEILGRVERISDRKVL